MAELLPPVSSTILLFVAECPLLLSASSPSADTVFLWYKTRPQRELNGLSTPKARCHFHSSGSFLMLPHFVRYVYIYICQLSPPSSEDQKKALKRPYTSPPCLWHQAQCLHSRCLRNSFIWSTQIWVSTQIWQKYDRNSVRQWRFIGKKTWFQLLIDYYFLKHSVYLKWRQ